MTHKEYIINKDTDNKLKRIGHEAAYLFMQHVNNILSKHLKNEEDIYSEYLNIIKISFFVSNLSEFMPTTEEIGLNISDLFNVLEIGYNSNSAEERRANYKKFINIAKTLINEAVIRWEETGI